MHRDTQKLKTYKFLKHLENEIKGTRIRAKTQQELKKKRERDLMTKDFPKQHVTNPQK